jgi:hypothetical protein
LDNYSNFEVEVSGVTTGGSYTLVLNGSDSGGQTATDSIVLTKQSPSQNFTVSIENPWDFNTTGMAISDIVDSGGLRNWYSLSTPLPLVGTVVDYITRSGIQSSGSSSRIVYVSGNFGSTYAGYTKDAAVFWKKNGVIQQSISFITLSFGFNQTLTLQNLSSTDVLEIGFVLNSAYIGETP